MLLKCGVPALAVLVIASGSAAGSDVTVDAGENLFYGRRVMTGQLYLHNRPFGAELVRCVNCHQLQDEVARPDARFGPALGGAFLTTLDTRRGGPARRYDADSFCAMLNSGIDPSGILIRTDMPRYRMSAAECRSLWEFLQKH